MTFSSAVGRVLLILPVLLAAAACRDSRSPERELVDRAVRFMGGADRLLGPRSLSIEGDGEVALLGQDVGTPSVPAAWKVTGWRRTIDLNARRMRVWQQTRQPMFVWAFKPPPPFSRGIDGAVAYDVVPDGTTLRA